MRRGLSENQCSLMSLVQCNSWSYNIRLEGALWAAAARASGGTAMVLYVAEKALVVSEIENAHAYVSLAFFSCMARARDEAKGSPAVFHLQSQYMTKIYESYDDVD